MSRRLIEQHLLDNWLHLLGYAKRLTRDGEAARELLQESAVHALAARHPPRVAGAIGAWLRRIIHNAWIDQYRRAAHAGMVPEAREQDAGDLWAFDDRLISELAVREALGRLDPLHREIIVLVDILGFRYREAAQLLQIPIGTVMSRVSRARLAMLELVRGQAPSAESEEDHADGPLGEA